MRPKKELQDIIHNGKLPPAAIEFEVAILGGLMIERDTFHRIENIVSSDDFYKDEHKQVFKSIKSLSDRNMEYDILSVTMDLKSRGVLESVGGPYGVTTLTNMVAGTYGIEDKAKKVKEYAIIRNVINVCGKYGRMGFEPGVDAFELVDQLLGELETSSKVESTQVQKLGDVARQTLLKMKNDSVMENDSIGIESSIKEVTEFTMGYSEPDLIILAAGTGEGKTTFALQEAFNMAKNGRPCAFVCMEMKAFQLCWKIFSSLIEESIMRIRMAKNISDTKWVQLDKIVEDMQNMPLYIVDATGQNINQITSLTKEFKRKYKIEMLFIDYLQLISGGSEKNFGNRELEVSYISRKLKENCMKMNLPTMALSQLTVEKGSKRMHELGDLRESKAIGMNADGVMFLYWPDYHGVETINGEFYGKNESVIIFGKYRMAGRKIIKVKFFPEYNKFESLYLSVVEAVNKPGRELVPFSEPLKDDEDVDLPF